MRIIQEGERGVALSPKLGRVPVVYRYRDLVLDSGIHVSDVLVGVHEDTDQVLAIPAQSTPRIKEARKGSKDEVLEARIPRELEDVLALLADHYRVTVKKFSPALIRYYLHAALEHPPLARRIVRLSRGPLAQGKRRGRIKVRCEARLCAQVERLAGRFDRSSQSDLVRGAIVAAKEDVLDRRAKGRSEKLRAVAAAV